MRKALLLLAVFGLAGALWAQSPFDGTWKTDLNKSQIPAPKPMVISRKTASFKLPAPLVNSTSRLTAPTNLYHQK